MTATPWPPAFEAHGTHVSIVPLSPAHHDDLARASTEGELHRLWYTVIPDAAGMGAEIDRRLALRAAGSMQPFALLRPDRRAVGMTTYMNIDAANRRVEIGSTWVGPDAQGTPLNTEAKLLLLRHAFEELDCIAVEFRTHVLNQQSRRAIERLGARLDGILRAHQIMPNGTLRDTAVYSITAAEWPAIRSHLEWQLARPRRGAT